MTDDAFYSPTHVPPVRTATRGEPLWQLRRDHVTWSAELRGHGESWGGEAQILREGDLVLGQRFLLHEPAVQFAEETRVVIQDDRWPTTFATRAGMHESPGSTALFTVTAIRLDRPTSHWLLQPRATGARARGTAGSHRRTCESDSALLGRSPTR